MVGADDHFLGEPSRSDGGARNVGSSASALAVGETYDRSCSGSIRRSSELVLSAAAFEGSPLEACSTSKAGV